MIRWTRPDPELAGRAVREPAFDVLTRAGIDLATARTWDRQLSRRQRLMVPIDVQAYVADDANGEAVVAVGGLPSDPAPFAPGEALPSGVHLHWAMPDSLLRGEQSDGETVGDTVTFPVLSDRWVVIRTVLPNDRERALVRGWVIDAVSKITVDLTDFDGTFDDPIDADAELETLDAAFGGGLLWTASYHASAGRFGFHDPLDDIEALSAVAPEGLHGNVATYTVCGWWSDVGDDALRGATGTAQVDDRLAELGWHVDHEGRDELHRKEQSVTERILEQNGLTSASVDAVTRVALDDRAISVTPIDIATEVPVADADSVIVGPARLRYLSMLHGSVLGVPLSDPPLTLGGSDGRPSSLGISVGAGLDVDDIVAALGSGALGTDEEQRELSERLAAAFTGDLLEQLDAPDGLDDLAEREHLDGFWPLPGPRVEGAQPDRLRPSESGGVHPASVGRKARTASAQEPAKLAEPRDPREFNSATVGAEVGNIEFAVSKDDLRAPLTTPLVDVVKLIDSARSVTRPAPRVFRPQAPMVGIRNLKPSLRHHGDGLHDDSGRLRVRYPSEVGDGYDGVLRGADIVPTLGSGSIPLEVVHAVREAVLLDPYVEEWHAAAASTASGLDTPIDVIRGRLAAEFARMYGTSATYDASGAAFLRVDDVVTPADSGPTPLAAQGTTWRNSPESVRDAFLVGQVAAETGRVSTWNGTTPSPVAITTWRQPWVPLWLEWEVRVVGGTDLDGWTLGSHDFEPTDPSSPTPGMSIDRTYLGRSVLSRGVGTALHEGIDRWLEAERRRDAADSVLTDEDEDALAALGGLFSPIDLVSASLDGLREQLLGIDYVGQIATATDDEDLPSASELPVPVFGGRMELLRLRVVDAFGRTLDVDTSIVRTTTTLELDGRANAIALRPRLLHNARWLFRLVDPGHPTDSDPLAARQAYVHQVEPTLAINPVAGYLLPDPIDEALEFFDTDGAPIGQLDHDGLSGAVRWETAPGRPLPPDAGPLADLAPQSQLMGRIATGLTAADVASRDGVVPGPASTGDSSLSSLLRAIDTTLWSVDTMAALGNGSVAGLIGRPVAVVRATLRLDAFDDVDEVQVTHAGGPDARRSAFDELDEQRFPVRLGDLARSDDALLGFFVDDDYERFHVVDRVVAAHALDTGRHRGHLGLLGQVRVPEQRPLDHDYIVQEDELWVRRGDVIRLTMLMLPAGRVHLTSGVLPRKALALADDWVRRALQRIVPSVRVGPVLIDPGDVRLPKVHALGEEQSFTRRTGPLTWRDDPIVSATQAALLPRMPHELHEGWVRVTPTEEES